MPPRPFNRHSWMVWRKAGQSRQIRKSWGLHRHARPRSISFLAPERYFPRRYAGRTWKSWLPYNPWIGFREVVGGVCAAGGILGVALYRHEAFRWLNSFESFNAATKWTLAKMDTYEHLRPYKHDLEYALKHTGYMKGVSYDEFTDQWEVEFRKGRGWVFPREVGYIVAANVLVWLMWKASCGSLRLHGLMRKYFMDSHSRFWGTKQWWAPVTASFSHMHGAHLAANMLALMSFASTAKKVTGDYFLPAYLATTYAVHILAGFGHLAISKVRKAMKFSLMRGRIPCIKRLPGLGASGVVSAIITFAMFCQWQRQVQVIIFPWRPFEAGNVFKWWISLECAGVLYQALAPKGTMWRMGHCYHLAGALMGYLAYKALVAWRLHQLRQIREGWRKIREKKLEQEKAKQLVVDS